MVYYIPSSSATTFQIFQIWSRILLHELHWQRMHVQISSIFYNLQGSSDFSNTQHVLYFLNAWVSMISNMTYAYILHIYWANLAHILRTPCTHLAHILSTTCTHLAHILRKPCTLLAHILRTSCTSCKYTNTKCSMYLCNGYLFLLYLWNGYKFLLTLCNGF